MPKEKVNKRGDKRGVKNSPVGKLKVRGRAAKPLNKVQEEEMIAVIIDSFCNGITGGSELNNIIQDSSPKKLSSTNIYTLRKTAINRLSQLSKQDFEVIKNVHVDLYELVYKYAKRINNTKLMAAALRNKEQLLKVGQKDERTAIINNKKTVKVIKEVPQYDPKKLTPVESKRINELINKAKK